MGGHTLGQKLLEQKLLRRDYILLDDSVENGGRPYPRTEALGVETPEIIDDSRENSRGGGHTLGQKLLEQKLLRRDYILYR